MLELENVSAADEVVIGPHMLGAAEVIDIGLLIDCSSSQSQDSSELYGSDSGSDAI